MSQVPRAASRRSVLKVMGATAGAAALTPSSESQGVLAFEALQRSGEPAALKVLSSTEFATLQAFVEAILPADDRSPGAREARVAEYLDLLLGESEDTAREAWRSGLLAVDREAQARFGAPFARLEALQLEALLTDWSRNEKAPRTALEVFFKTTKDAAVHGYYTSEIGIHRELRYKGNSFTPQFVGCAAEDGQDCPHCGQKAGR